MSRTKAYRFTVEMENGKPIGSGGFFVDFLREIYKDHNQHSDRKFYVKLQGRGPRIHNGRKYFQSLPLKYAERADVYVYERR